MMQIHCKDLLSELGLLCVREPLPGKSGTQIPIHFKLEFQVKLVRDLTFQWWPGPAPAPTTVTLKAGTETENAEMEVTFPTAPEHVRVGVTPSLAA